MYVDEAVGASPIDTRVTAAPSTGSDEPVFVLPGFLGSDLSTAPLRSMLRAGGYDALRWKFGTNLGPSHELMQRLVDRIARIASTRRQRVSLVGHSLGGLYAREIAKTAPHLVQIVITLGSPIRALEPNNPYANLDIVRTIERICGRTVTELQQQGLFCNLTAPLAVPCVALYSKKDRIAPWQTCLQTPSWLARNVEVETTHVGMLINASVGRLIREQLAAAGNFDA
jgi:poly(3-hydroxyalkanoate) synthetase